MNLSGPQKRIASIARRYERYQAELDWQSDEDLEDELWASFSHDLSERLAAMQRPSSLNS